MAQKVTTTPQDFSAVIASEAELENTTSEDLFDGPKTVRGMTLDNSGYASPAFYKFYDALSADPSSDVPDLMIRAAASTKLDVFISDGISFSTGFSARCVQSGDDTDTTAPTTLGPGFFIGS